VNFMRLVRSSSNQTLASSISGDSQQNLGLDSEQRQAVESRLQLAREDLITTDREFSRAKINNVNSFYHFSVIARHLISAKQRLGEIEPLLASSGVYRFDADINALKTQISVEVDRLNYKKYKIAAREAFSKGHRASYYQNHQTAIQQFALAKANALVASDYAESAKVGGGYSHKQWKGLIKAIDKAVELMGLESGKSKETQEAYHDYSAAVTVAKPFAEDRLTGLVNLVRERDYRHSVNGQSGHVI